MRMFDNSLVIVIICLPIALGCIFDVIKIRFEIEGDEKKAKIFETLMEYTFRFCIVYCPVVITFLFINYIAICL